MARKASRGIVPRWAVNLSGGDVASAMLLERVLATENLSCSLIPRRRTTDMKLTRSFSRIVFVVLAMFMVLGLTVEAAPKSTLRIGVSVNGLGNEFNRSAYYATLDAAKKAGHQVIAVDGKGEIRKMYDDMENLITQKVDAIINICGTLTAMVPVVQRAERAGIPVISLDAGYVEGVAVELCCNNWAIGATIGTYLLNRMDGKGKVFSFINPDHHGIRKRGDTFKAILKEYPSVELTGEHRVIWPNSIPDSRAAMESMLKATPDVKGVFCGFDLPAIGVAQAIESAGRKDIIVVGCDGDLQALQYIKKGGPIVATIVQDCDTEAHMAIDLAERLVRGEKLKTKTEYAPFTLVTENNIDQFLK